MEIPLRRGRFFTEEDSADKAPVVIVDEAFAKRFWPEGDPIGRHLWFDPKKPITIVGVVGSVKQYGLGTDEKVASYFPYAQFAGQRMFLAVRTASEVAGLSTAVVGAIHAVDPDVAVYGTRTMEERLYASLARERFASTMLGAFAVFALLLAAVGLYGVVSHLVTQSTHDIGILVSLGAPRGNIIGLVVRQGMRLSGIGIAVGLLGALGLTSVMSALLFGVSRLDALTFLTVPALLAAVAVAATAIPAWRATRVDPIVALRED
jgi:predicted permease